MVTKKRKEKKEEKKKEKRAEDPVQKAQGTTPRPKLKRSTPARTGDAIRLSARDVQSYADILREMKAKVDLRSCLSAGPGRKKSFWSSKRGETFLPSARSSTERSGRGQKFRPWSRRGPSKLGTLTRPLKKKRLCLPCAWHWADQHSTGSFRGLRDPDPPP